MDKKDRMKYISYFIMGDGGVYTIKKNTKFIMNILKKHQDFVEEFKSLVDFTSVNVFDRKDYNTDGRTRQPQIRVETGCHPKFTAFRDRIYRDNYKGLDPIYIKQLDWHGLAILYQSDGSLGESFRPEIGMKNPSYNVTLNMKRLSYGDLELLGKYLTRNLGLYWTIQRQNQYYYIRFKMKSFERLMSGISPYIHNSFKYKIRTVSPTLVGDDIVCSSQECEEGGRNDLPQGVTLE